MAILESEKRPRGLRVPSLSSLKAFHKKSSDSSQQQQQQQKMDALPETPTSATTTTGGPPWEKHRPPNPYQAASPTPMAAPTPMRVPPPSTASAFGLEAVPMGNFGSDRYPMPSAPAREYNPSMNNHMNAHANSLAVPSVQRTPSNGSQRTADSEPLEDFIPEPEPEAIDGIYSQSASPATPGAAIEPVSSGEEPNGNGNNHNHNHLIPDNGVVDEDDDDWEPPEVDVAAPLEKLHFACYQEHRSMPTSANVWYAVPCMTCQKLDREVRHRCVFCCLRVCEGCYQGLQKCQRRSLEELLLMIQG